MAMDTLSPFRAMANQVQLGNRLNAVIDHSIAAEELAGAVVLVARHGQLVYQRTAGFADREAGRAMQPDSLFRLGSLSKLITSTAAMVQVARGQVGLEDPVSRWLPAFTPALADGTPAALTIRHLMSHTAGLGYRAHERAPQRPYACHGVSDGFDKCPWSLDDNLRRLAAAPLLYPPGSSWGDSLATDVLGALVACVNQSDLATAVAQWVGAPLGWQGNAFQVTQPERLCAVYHHTGSALARLHQLTVLPRREGCAGLRLDPTRAFDPEQFQSGGAGMVASAGDLLHLLEALRCGDDRLLPGRYVTEMSTPLSSTLRVPGRQGWGHGLGFSVVTQPQRAQVPHSAGSWYCAGEYNHCGFVDPTQQLSVVALTNTAFDGMSDAFTRRLRDALYQAL